MRRYLLAVFIFISVVAIIKVVYSCTTYKIDECAVNHEVLVEKVDSLCMDVLLQTVPPITTTGVVDKIPQAKSEKAKIKHDSIAFNNVLTNLKVLFADWKTIMDKEHHNWVQIEQTNSKNFATWLAIIAAICTVLPVVLALHQSQTFEKLEKDIDEKTKIIDHLSKRISVTQLLDTSSRNLIVLNNLTDLEIKEKALVSCEKEVRNSLQAVLDNVESCKKQIADIFKVLDAGDKKIIINSYISFLCILREMIYRYESELSGSHLVRLQQHRYLISLSINHLLDVDDSKIDDINTIMDDTYHYVSTIKFIFEAAIEDAHKNNKNNA